MCNTCDGFNVEISTLEAKFFKCGNCKNEFKGIGNKVMCPSCHSSNVSMTSKEE